MIYLIGGVARSGKTQLAKAILDREGIPFISTDTLIDMVRTAAPGLELSNWGRQKAEDFAPFVQRLVYHLPFTVDPYVVEGNGFWPHHIASFAELADVRACFLGYSSVELADLQVGASWWDQIEPAKHGDILQELLAESAEIRAECEGLSVPYFDVMPGDASTLERAYSFLLSHPGPGLTPAE